MLRPSLARWAKFRKLGVDFETARLKPVGVADHVGRVAKTGGNQMKIGQLASRAGLNASAIRFYEKRSLLPQPQRQGHQRRYPAEALNRILLIHFASEMGFTLSEIKLFLSGIKENAPPAPRWKKLAHRKLAEVEQQMQRSRRLKSLLEHLLHCRCSSLAICVHRLSLSPNLRSLQKPDRQSSANPPPS
jgi:MerR family transcriptional regulator, redox-sensitive transcriptional activator SoxR